MTERYQHDDTFPIVLVLVLGAISLCGLWSVDRDQQRKHELTMRRCAEVQTNAK